MLVLHPAKSLFFVLWIHHTLSGRADVFAQLRAGKALQLSDARGEHAIGMAGCSVDSLESGKAGVDDNRQFCLMRNRRNTADGKAGGFSHQIGVCPFSLALEAKRGRERLSVTLPITGDQCHHRLAVNGKHQGFDDAAELGTDAVGSVLGAPRRLAELNHFGGRVRLGERSTDALNRRVF